jgi:outer membrane protein OmpA-like peptidoglycan-associated protein
MRLRNWLLTGTSLAALAMLPGTAFAQQAEYQDYVDAQASGDADAIDAAQQALTEACIVNGYGSVAECIAAITGGGAPAADTSAADAEAEAAAAAAAQAEADAAAAAQAEAEAQAAAAAQAEAEAAAAAQAEADAQAAAAAQAEAEAAAAAQAEAEAEAAAAAQAEADAQAAAAAQAEADAAAAAQAEAEAAAAQAEADAQAAAAAQAEAEAAAAAQAEEEAAPVEEPLPVEEPAADEPTGPSAEEIQAQFVADLQAALDQYQAALDQAAAGDYNGAVPVAAAAEARILELCLANGYPDIVSCIGQELPPLPQPPAEQTPEEPSAPAAEDIPAEQPVVETPVEETPAEQLTEAAPEEQAAEAAEPDPVAAAQDQLAIAVELYNVGVGQLQAGDASGSSTIEAANRQFAEICSALGTAEVAACLAQYGITLPPVPELAASTEPALPAIADLPGAQEIVTPQAVEVLPEALAPESAAPVLDSAKDTSSRIAGGEAPVEVVPEEPAAPPPTDDQSAQAAIVPVEVRPLREEQGERITLEALPQMEVPQNVTIINNVTNITNTTTINNETTTINNNGGNRPGGDRPGGDRPGGDRPGGRPDGGNNYTNSGFIFQIGVNLVISNPAQDFDRIRDFDDEVYYDRLPGGRVRETIERPNGVQIVTIRDRWGNVLKRSRILPDGREYILAYYNEDDYDDEDYFGNWRDPGNDLPPLRLTIPIRDYIIDADYSDEDEVEMFFRQPPVEQVRRIYTVEDVKRSARLRDSVRRIEVGSLTFDTGAATIARSQVGLLSKVANAMLAMLEDNPGEVFLIEGHTDAVGSDQANLVLSDARASTVARILTDFYDVPPENLVTQGYGERYLKVQTQAAEPLNRRVAIKRITPLITVASR